MYVDKLEVSHFKSWEGSLGVEEHVYERVVGILVAMLQCCDVAMSQCCNGAIIGLNVREREGTIFADTQRWTRMRRTRFRIGGVRLIKFGNTFLIRSMLSPLAC